MFDLTKLPPDARLYFDSLSPLMRENLIQSGVPYSSLSELRAYVDKQAPASEKKI